MAGIVLKMPSQTKQTNNDINKAQKVKLNLSEKDFQED